MQWLNIHISDLQSEEFLGSEPTDRATWLSLLCYCANQENGGVIDGASAWSDRMCQQVLGVTKDELHADCLLWTHLDSSVTLWAYPVDQEAAVQAKRKGGRAGGISRQAKLKAKLEGKPKAKPQGKVKEGKVKKGKENEMVFTELWMMNDNFKAAWAEWERHRSEKRNGLTPSTITKQIKKLSKMGESAAISSIQNSITNGYTGLFAVDAKTAAATTTPDALVTSNNPDDWKME